MITTPLPLSLPATEIKGIQLLSNPRCAELHCRDAAGHVHVLRCNLWTLDRLAREVWSRPVRIAFLSEVAGHLGNEGLWSLPKPWAFRLPALAFDVLETQGGVRYLPILPASCWQRGEKKLAS
jgi:hypothetical protein